MKELLERFNYNLTRVKKLPELRQRLKDNNKKLDEKLKSLDKRILLIQDSRVAYQKTIDAFYEESIGKLEALINLALSNIFQDRGYQIKIELSGEDKKDKSFSFDIVTKNGDIEDLRDGAGDGIKAIISFVVLSYYLIQYNSPYIFVDELYSAISDEYVDRFFEFVHKLCDEQGLVFIMISHDPRFMNYADQLVRVSNGKVTILNDLNYNTLADIQKEIEIEDEQENKKQNKRNN